MTRARSPNRRRIQWPALRRAEWLVLGTVAAAAMLIGAAGWLLRDTMVRHRATADETLRDHAAYMGGSFANSVQSESWFGVRSLLRLAQRESALGATALTLDSLRTLALADAIGPGLPPLWPTNFVIGDSAGWRSLVEGVAIDSPLVAAIESRIGAPLDSTFSFHGTIVVRPVDTTLAFFERGRRGGWVAVEVPLGPFRKAVIAPPINRLAYAFERLRDSLQLSTGDTVPPLAVRIVTANGITLFALGPTPTGEWSMTRRILPSVGARLHLAVLPAAVPVLMPGGYPPAPGPRVALAMGIASLVLIAAAWLAWRSLALARLRDEFTSTVPHELRTPLTNIQLWAETLLLDRARTPDDRRAALETITRETRRLVHMVENVLAFTRVGRPNLQLVLRPEHLTRLVSDATTSFDPLFRANGIAADVTVTGPPTVLVDGDAVRRILVNLIDNAVRYGPAGQTIRVTAMHADDWLELGVEDEGSGVAVSDRERIWRPFERATQVGASGTGIGLAVVRQLVTLHGGTATVRDGQRGAHFIVRLPVSHNRNGSQA